jgi:hypothetical protein
MSIYVTTLVAIPPPPPPGTIYVSRLTTAASRHRLRSRFRSVAILTSLQHREPNTTNISDTSVLSAEAVR